MGSRNLARHRTNGTAEPRRRRQLNTRKSSHRRGLRIEQFEDRLLLSINPDLIGVMVGDTTYQPEMVVAPTLNEAPQEITLRFTEGQSINPATFTGIQITRAGANEVFYDVTTNPNDVDDVVIVPGWVGLGDKANEVIVRFAETLPDDLYRVTIAGSGYNRADGKLIGPLTNTTGNAFRHGVDQEEFLAWDFTLDLAPQVVAVVPQPITRNEDGSLDQSRNTIEVYFSAGDKLSDSGTLDPTYFQLIATGDTATPSDDLYWINPGNVFYEFDAATGLNKATLDFSTATFHYSDGTTDTGVPIADLADNFATGSLRLRIGNEYQTIETTPSSIVDTLNNDAVGSSFSSAADLNNLTTNGVIVDAAIGPLPYSMQFPGATDEPGHRDLPAGLGEDNESHTLDADVDASLTGTIDTYTYTFPATYTGSTGESTNLITESQKEAVRRMFTVFQTYFGVQFSENVPLSGTNTTANMSIILGDPRALGVPGGPTGLQGYSSTDPITGDGEVVINSSIYSNDEGQLGGGFWNVTMHELLHQMGLTHAYDVLGDTIMSGGETTEEPALSDDAMYPGNADIVHAQLLHRPDSIDIDLYKFTVDAEGTLSVGTFAEQSITNRDGTPDLLDTTITLYDETGNVVARNDDYFGTDSFVDVHLTAGTYFVGVASKGNDLNDPTIEDSGIGGTTQGDYQLRLNFTADVDSSSTLSDTTGQALDGDMDGVPGGVYDFWFTSQTRSEIDDLNHTLIVDKNASGSIFDGTLTHPFKYIGEALAAAEPGDIVRIVGNNTDNDFGGMAFQSVAGTQLIDGQKFTISDGALTVTFEFDKNNSVGANNVRIPFLATYSAENIATSIVNAINGTFRSEAHPLYIQAKINADNPKIIELEGPVAIFSPGSGPSASPLTSTLQDNTAYEIGFDQYGRALKDGTKLEVPKGVTVMIDAGAVLKLRRANVDVGSSMQGIDRSLGALQALGTPGSSVYFTSFFDKSLGTDSYGGVSSPTGGNWGGLVFRNELDYDEAHEVLESEGIFLNYVNHADIRYGGGLVNVGSVSQAYSSIYMEEARPTITFNKISYGADYAVSADPNSFLESNFESNDAADPYTLDYGRVGPMMAGNTLNKNSGNGLRVRIQEQSGSSSLDVSARFRDCGMVYVLTSNLVISGNAGGPIQYTATGEIAARQHARLAIDPGVIVKLDGSRIETETGAQFIAEGTPTDPVRFTSLDDDRFGGGGTFDTGSNGQSSGLAGDWAGLYFGLVSSASIDNAEIYYGGGQSPIEGGYAHFNVIEIQQAKVRIANTLLRDNAADGSASDQDPDRNGRGTVTPATIYIRGAQPVIVDNTLINNAGAAISIDINSMKAVVAPDWGRSTGYIDLNHAASDTTPSYLGFDDHSENYGPLVDGNRITNSAINGMVVRGGTLTTDSIWDDTDIVHVLYDEIVVPNFHTYGGLRLQSSGSESLVVKLMNAPGANAGFTATGTPLEISDRIGGTVQVIGSPGHPVILTSLADDSVGAGFNASGNPQRDTNNNGQSAGQPGDWRGIVLDSMSNDRNVSVANEIETPANDNDTPTNAQGLGSLATTLKGGDENLRLGFEVLGNINADADADTYSFQATAGTEVWINIDKTLLSLDTVLELVDVEGNVIARSDNKLAEEADPTLYQTLLAGNIARTMSDSVWEVRDYYSINPNDAGMRIVLPGTLGQTRTYYVRVSSYDDPATTEITDGIYHDERTSGAYRLQVRLQQTAEVAGSMIHGASILYATDAIELQGLPTSSPILTESGDVDLNGGTNNTSDTAQDLGNLLETNLGTLGVGGYIANPNDIDWYRFTVDLAGIQRISPVSGTGSQWSTIFDIDYADGMTRPDLTLWVFNSLGQLILTSTDSNVADDQANNDATDLSAASFGPLDPYIGPAFLPETNETYYVAVTTTAVDANAFVNQTLLRREPIDSVDRIAEDHINDVDQTGSPIAEIIDLGLTPTEWTLQDVVTYVTTTSDLRTVNPVAGIQRTDVTGAGSLPNNPGWDYKDIAMRDDGRLYAISGVGSDGSVYMELSTVDGSILSSQGLGITTHAANADGTGLDANPGGLTFEALAHAHSGSTRLVWAVGNIQGNTNGVTYTGNLLYVLDADGNAIQHPDAGDKDRLGTDIVPFAILDTGFGTTITGLTILGGVMYAVDDAGNVFTLVNFDPTVDPSNAAGVWGVMPVEADSTIPVPVLDSWDLSGAGPTLTLVGTISGYGFTGLTTGPQNVENGNFANVLFATSDANELVAFDVNGVLQNIFAGGNSVIALTDSTGNALSNVAGMAFSTLDYNLWHQTYTRGQDEGHGIYNTFDSTRNASNGYDRSQPLNTANGLASYYFGFEDPSLNSSTHGPVDSDNAQAGAANYSSNSDLYGTYNLPGGAIGSLVTQTAFSLKGYSAEDLPRLYFNYYLASEGSNDYDSARVYVTTDGGANWSLLATNDDLDYSVDVHLIDNTDGWLQAVIDLGDYVGYDNIQLRFDFNTAGDMALGEDPLTALGGSYLKAVAGNQLDDGVGFVVDGNIYEFDMGASITVPNAAGASIPDSEQFTVLDGSISRIFEFDNNGALIDPTAIPILIDASMSAEDVAALIQTALTGSGLAVTSTISTERLSAPGVPGIPALPAIPAVPNPIPGFPDLYAGYPGRDATTGVTVGVMIAGATAIDIAQSPSAGYEALSVQQDTGLSSLSFPGAPTITKIAFLPTDTAEQIAQAIADAIDASGTTAKVDGSMIRLFGHAVDDAGVLAYGDELPGDGGNRYFNQLSGQNNAYEGFYIDDLIVGFAERGELITNASADTTFVANPNYNSLAEITSGYYQMEIREATPYGTTLSDTGRELNYTALFDVDDDPLTVDPPLTINTNDRLSQSITLTVPAATQLNHLETFQISDGEKTVTFQFVAQYFDGTTWQDAPGYVASADIVAIRFKGTETPGEVAAAIATAINQASQGSSALFAVRAVANSDNLDVMSDAAWQEAAVDLLGAAWTSGIGLEVFDMLGDQNRTRDQGMVIIDACQIMYSSGYGIVVEPDTRNVANLAHPSSPAPLLAGDSAGLAPGVSIINNVIAFSGEGGIHVMGDSNDSGSPKAAVPYVRIVNNTIYGSGAATNTTATLTFVKLTGNSGIDGNTGVYRADLSGIDLSSITSITIRDNSSQLGGVPGQFSGFDLDGIKLSTTLITDATQINDTAGLDVFDFSPAGTVLIGGTQRPPVDPALFGTLDGQVDNSVATLESFDANGNLSGQVSLGDDGTITFYLTSPVNTVGLYLYIGEAGDNGEVAASGVEVSSGSSQVGVRIDTSAAATLLNNVVANFGTGISVDASSAGNVVIGATAYQNNTSSAIVAGLEDLGSFPLVLDPGDPLFIDPENGNFYPADGSPIIDSSQNGLADRPALTAVRSPLGIPVSPIVAPSTDLYGQLRIDDPNAANSGGMGENVFKDRGAIDRVDFDGPVATLAKPLDNASSDYDKNPNAVALIGQTLSKFTIQLDDTGSGIDDDSVVQDVLSIVQDLGMTEEIELEEGKDYLFVYNPTAKTIDLVPTAGTWFADHTYTIRFDNSIEDGNTIAPIADIVGNPIQPNQVDLSTTLTILLAQSKPKVVDVIDVTPDPRTGSVSTVDVLIRGLVNVDTAVPSLSLKRGGVTLFDSLNPPTSVVKMTHISGFIYRIEGLNDYTTDEGEYELMVDGAKLRDKAGVVGEGSKSDIFVVDRTPPDVTLTLGTPALTNDNTPPVTVTAAELDGTQVFLDLSADGVFDDVGEISYTVSALTGGSAAFDVLPALADGTYSLRARVIDLAGNEGTSDVVTVAVDATPPTVVDIVDVDPDPRNTSVASVDVEFSEEINLSTFTYEDLALTRTFLGVTSTIELDGAVTTAFVAGTTYRIAGLAGFTLIDGTYVLTLSGGGVEDLAGNTAEADASESWLMDAARPEIVEIIHVTPDLRNTAVSSIDVVLSKLIDLATFTYVDLTLSRDGLPVTLADAVTVEYVSDTTYRINGLDGFTSDEGVYDLFVNAWEIQDQWGNTGLGSASDTWTVETQSPTVIDVTDVTPDPRNASVDSVEVVFDEPIALASFTYADITLTRGGTAVTLNDSVTMSLVSGNTYRIDGLGAFTTANGTYNLTFHGDGINDVAGNVGVGEVSDTWIMDTMAPAVTDIVDVSPDPRNAPVSEVDVTFSEVIDPTTFTYEDLALTRDGQSVALDGSISVSLLSGTTYRVDGLGAFTSDDGTYVLTLNGGGVKDRAGNTGTGAASDTWVMDTTPPEILDIVDVSPDPRKSPVASVNVTFNKSINLSTFTFEDLALTQNGLPVTLDGTITTSLASGTTYRIDGLGAFTAGDGPYELTLDAAGIQDTVGNTGVGTVLDSWITDAVAPAITDVVDVTPDPRNTSVSDVEVIFSELIDLSTFTYKDLQLTRGGVSLLLSDSITISLVSGTTYRISGLNPFTSSGGTYVLSVNASGILDTVGNAGVGSASDTWVCDTTPPMVADVIDVSPDPRNTAVSSIDVVFSEPIVQSTFTDADFTLTYNGLPVDITGTVTLAWTSETRCTIGGLSGFTSNDGTYVLTVNAGGVQDVAGNAGVGFAADTWIVDTSSASVVDIVNVSPDPRNTPVPTVDLSFSEQVNLSTFTHQDLTLTRDGATVALNSTVTIGLVAGTTYRISGLGAFTSGNGTYVLTVAGAGIADNAGNPVSDSADDTWSMDAVAPWVVSSTRMDLNPSNANSVRFLLTFSEPVTGLDAADLAVVAPSLSGAKINGIADSNGLQTAYIVTVSTGTGNGSLRLDLIDNDTIRDLRDNPLGGAGAGNGNFFAGQSYTIDKTLLPKIAVECLGQVIIDGEMVSSLSDGTDFGSTVVGDPALTRTFTVRNTGTSTLSLLAPVLPAGFTITEPLNGTIIPGGSDAFTVQLSSATAGTFAGDISITSNDGSQNPFNFRITGAVTTLAVAAIRVEGLGQIIADGDTTPDAADGTNFGSVLLNSALPTRTFTVRNTGTIALALGTPTLPGGYTIAEPLSGTIAPGGSDTFTVQLGTAAAGTFAGDIAFTTNDAVNPLFNFRITGTVSAAESSYCTIGLFNPTASVFSLRNSNSAGLPDEVFNYGPANLGWLALSGDWNGDGTETIGLYSPASSVFFLKNSNAGGVADMTFNYGPAGAGWTPIVGDWNGDGIDTIGLYNPANATFYLRNTNTAGIADATFFYGPANVGWKPIAGDWDSDGNDTVGLYSPASSTFYLKNTNSAGFADSTFVYGPAGAGWSPLAGDWNGDGQDTIGLYNPSTSEFFLKDSNAAGPADVTFNFGTAGSGFKPIVGNWDGLGNALTAADGPAASASTAALTQAELEPIVDEALARWSAAGLDSAALAKLEQVRFVIGDLPGSYLGKALTDQITIDRDAAGYGWFVDSTPARDEEFILSAGGQRQAIDPRAVDGIDLLTVVEHELGHIAGLDDLDILADNLMSGSLKTGVRRDV